MLSPHQIGALGRHLQPRRLRLKKSKQPPTPTAAFSMQMGRCGLLSENFVDKIRDFRVLEQPKGNHDFQAKTLKNKTYGKA